MERKMHPNLRISLVAVAVALILPAGPLRGKTKPAPSPQAAEALKVATPDQIIQYVRHRFQVPASVKLTAEPLHKSSYSPFYETLVTSDDGKEKHTNNIF